MMFPMLLFVVVDVVGGALVVAKEKLILGVICFCLCLIVLILLCADRNPLCDNFLHATQQKENFDERDGSSC